MSIPKRENLIAAVVAVATVAIALAGGGFAPTAFAAGGLVVWLAVLVGLATGWLPRAEPLPTAIAAGLCLAGLAALMALSLTWGDDPGRGFDDVVRAVGYLGVFVLVGAAARRGEAGAWLRGLAVGLAAVAAIALLARFIPGPFGDPDADLAASVPAALGRLSYPVGYWNGLAASMAAAIVLLIWLGAVGRTRVGRSLAIGAVPIAGLALWATDSRGGIVATTLAVIVLVAIGPHRSRLVVNAALASIASVALIAIAGGFDALFDAPTSPEAVDQRSAVLAIAIGAALVAGGLRWLADDPVGRFVIARRHGRIAVGAAAVAVLAAVVLANPVERWEQFKQAPTGEEIAEGQVDLLRGGGSGRYQLWQTGTNAFSGDPIAGVGVAGFAPYWFEHRESAVDATRAHSLLFETLAELGIFGVALLVGFIAIPIVVALRRWRAVSARDTGDPSDRFVAGTAELGPALAVLVVGLLAAAVDWTWDLPAVFAPTLVAAALLCGSATLPAGAARDPARVFGAVRSRRRFAGGVGVLIVAWVAICGSGLLLLADHALSSSQGASAEGDLEAAIDSANDAIDLEPWAAEPRTQLALLYEKAGDFGPARAEIAEAIDRAPRDYQLYLLAARISGKANDAEAAGANLLRARALNPKDPVIQEAIAQSGAAASEYDR